MKIKNIFGNEYTGTAGESMVMFMRNGVNVARKHVTPHDPKTESQLSQRNMFRMAVFEWQKLSAEEKQSWKERAGKEKTCLSGYNLFIGRFMKEGKKAVSDR